MTPLISLSNIIFAGLSDNNLSGASLELLLQSTDNLGGRIPDALGRLTNLRLFDVGSNMVSGTNPSSLFNLSLMKLLMC
ncbi:conserved hypothetical protein [Ricinus communis]|uniref:Serine-threonine protein kinase, plant-type n=1 Tax=Ricinus communis TaxID=3988 RepID=B9SXB5_RICCO|nr:conserved hypothetical protein [Ricinus communis]